MTSSAPAPRPDPPAGAWTRTRTSSGALRLEHVATRSLIYVGRSASEAEIQRRIAEAEQMIRRLQRRAIGR